MYATMEHRRKYGMPYSVMQRYRHALLALVSTAALTACAGGQIEELEAQLAQQRAEMQQLQQQAEERAEAQARELEEARMAAEEAQRERREAEQTLEAERARLEAARQRSQEQARQEAVRARELQEAREAQARTLQRAQREARVEALEAELAAIQQRIEQGQRANVRMRDAIVAAEELLQMLDSEQQKYDDVDASGQTREPLQKGLIGEQEERLSRLVEEARALAE
jgi:chromosome segregation ATPase